MKIDKVIMSCDDNQSYLNLWPYVSKICKLTLNITPVLFHVTDEYSDFVSDKYGIIKKIKKHPELPSSFQSQIYRLYGTKFFKNETSLISDLDMFIFNKNYFVNQVKDYHSDDFVVYLSDAYDMNRSEVVNMYALNRVPMCYVLGKGETYTKLLDMNCDFNEFAEKVYNYDFGYEVPDFHKDEVFLGKMILRNNQNINIVKLNRGITNIWNINKRIEKKMFLDRNLDLSNTENYVDCHIPKEYESNINVLNEIMNKILTNY